MALNSVVYKLTAILDLALPAYFGLDGGNSHHSHHNLGGKWIKRALTKIGLVHGRVEGSAHSQSLVGGRGHWQYR